MVNADLLGPVRPRFGTVHQFDQLKIHLKSMDGWGARRNGVWVPPKDTFWIHLVEHLWLEIGATFRLSDFAGSFPKGFCCFKPRFRIRQLVGNFQYIVDDFRVKRHASSLAGLS